MSENQGNEQKQFQTARLFVKQQRFESDTPAVFKELETQVTKAKEEKKEIKPDNRLELKIDLHDLEEKNLHEVVLTLKLTAKADTLELYTAEVSQAGIFVMNHYSKEERETILNGYAASVLYPYATQILMTMIKKGGFLVQPLPPVNFDALYQQKKKQAESKNKAADEFTQVKEEFIH